MKIFSLLLSQRWNLPFVFTSGYMQGFSNRCNQIILDLGGGKTGRIIENVKCKMYNGM